MGLLVMSCTDIDENSAKKKSMLFACFLTELYWSKPAWWNRI